MPYRGRGVGVQAEHFESSSSSWRMVTWWYHPAGKGWKIAKNLLYNPATTELRLRVYLTWKRICAGCGKSPAW